MLRSLALENVGPVPDLDVSFGERLNLLTGDNGLGKSFLLDCCWWALTRTWPRELNSQLTAGYQAVPVNRQRSAHINVVLKGKSTEGSELNATFNARDDRWIPTQGRPVKPGLVIYAHSDGGFSVWDPARNYWQPSDGPESSKIPGYSFTSSDVWNGLTIKRPATSETTVVCNGLISDWAGWIKESGQQAHKMRTLLNAMSPDGEAWREDGLTRLTADDARDIPALAPPYEGRIPVVHCSAGMRRIMGLSYMLLWAYSEHVIASELIGEVPTTDFVILVDEVESHLHPRWQRTILRSLLGAASVLSSDADLQLLVATHSPLVLASAEPRWKHDTDRWFDFDLSDGIAYLEERDFVRQGSVGSWLTSEAFDLGQPRSEEAEAAMADALSYLQRRHAGHPQGDVESITSELRATLPEIDSFWMRWSAAIEGDETGATRPGSS